MLCDDGLEQGDPAEVCLAGRGPTDQYFVKQSFAQNRKLFQLAFLTVSVRKGKGEGLRTGVGFPTLAHPTGEHLAVPASLFLPYFLYLPMIISDHCHASTGRMNNIVSFWSRSLREVEFAVSKNKLDMIRVK